MERKLITWNPDVTERAFNVVLVLMHGVPHVLQELLGNTAPEKYIGICDRKIVLVFSDRCFV